MPRRILFFFVLAMGIVSGMQLAVMLTSLSPYQASNQQLGVFFVSLAAFCTSLLSIMWYAVKVIFNRYSTRVPQLHVCVRQAFLVSIVATGLLVLNSLNILNWWEAASLCISAILIEFFFQADTYTSLE